MLYYLIGPFWSESARISIRTIDTGHFADVLMTFEANLTRISMLKIILQSSCLRLRAQQSYSSRSGRPKSRHGISLSFSSALYELLVLKWGRRTHWCHILVWSSRFSSALVIIICHNDYFTKAARPDSVCLAAIAVAIIIRMVLILPWVNSFEVFGLALALAEHEEKYENCHDYPLEYSLWAHRWLYCTVTFKWT